MSYTISGTFLKDIQKFFDTLPELAQRATSAAINQVVDNEGIALLRHNIESQIAFPKGYLNQADRLGVVQKATPSNLQAVIRGRDRATSLARFAPGQTPSSTRGTGVTVQVKKGRARHMKKAFLVRLNNDNIGLAVRLKQGESLTNKRETATVMLSKNVYLLYGPSVDQIFRTTAEESLPEIGDLLTKAFNRQFERLAGR